MPGFWTGLKKKKKKKKDKNLKIFAAIFCPVAFLANIWLLLPEIDSTNRIFFCGLLVAARNTIAYVHVVIFFFSIIFRMVLVVHPERGLVINGRTNLSLFKKLFWLIVCSFIVLGFITSPLTTILRGTFPLGSQAGKICLLLNGEGSMKGFKIQAVLASLDIFFSTYAYLRIKRNIKRMCPKNIMSCIGNYQRNVLSLKQTLILLLFFCFGMYISLVFFKWASITKVSSNSIYWIWNARGFLNFEGPFFVLPLFLKVPNINQSPKPFFKTEDGELEPRRQLGLGQQNVETTGNTNALKLLYRKPSFHQNELKCFRKEYVSYIDEKKYYN